MKKWAYYNEFDKVAAAWLRELIANNLIAPGEVDERSIKDVRADDIRGFAQCHAFGGIGVWSAALRRNGWEDARPVGTASCPCQGFSVAGKGLGFADPRHLWPDYLRLVDEAREQGQPWASTLIGEQSANAGDWLDLVQTQLEDRAYAFGATDIPAAGFGMGAHIRQRFYWVADRDNTERWSDMAGRDIGDWAPTGRVEGYGESGAGGVAGGLADTSDPRELGRRQFSAGIGDTSNELGAVERSEGLRPSEWLGHGHGHGQGLEGRSVHRERGDQRAARTAGLAGAEWLWCRDEKFRPVEAGTFPLAATSPGRVGLLRGYGNSLDLETAVNFIGAYMDALETRDVMAELA